MTEVEAQLKTDRTYALAMNLLDFGRFLAGCAREKSSNCVSPKPSPFKVTHIQLQFCEDRHSKPVHQRK